jgi:hypothetical protein
MLRHAWYAVLIALCAIPAGAAWPAADHTPDVAALAAAHAGGLAALTSDQDAKAFFSSRLEAALGLPVIRDAGEKARGKYRPSPPVAPAGESHDVGARFTAELAAWRLAHTIEQGASDAKALSTVLADSEKQVSWLTGDGRHPALEQTWRRAGAAALFPERSSDAPPQPSYIEYADYLDRHMVQTAEGDDTWLNLVDRDGADGMRRALRSFWDQAVERRDAPEEEKLAYAARYVHSRLRPLLRASVDAAATRAETEAERHARTYWDELKSSAENAKRRRGLARLCGTWQWTVHNHQNHLDHKSVMTVPSPDSPNGGLHAPAPAQMVVLGDVVYLRWEFQGGVQEDSLLFTGEGRRLEGTFVTSTGAWGSITGKRTGSCQP